MPGIHFWGLLWLSPIRLAAAQYSAGSRALQLRTRNSTPPSLQHKAHEPYRTVLIGAYFVRCRKFGAKRIFAAPERRSGAGAAAARRWRREGADDIRCCARRQLLQGKPLQWFGDRDGLLSAMIAYQASKVRTVRAQRRDADGGRACTTISSLFARDLLDVLAGDVSLALNRLAIGQASRGWLQARQAAAGARTTPDRPARAWALIEAGKRAGLLRSTMPTRPMTRFMA